MNTFTDQSIIIIGIALAVFVVAYAIKEMISGIGRKKRRGPRA